MERGLILLVAAVLMVNVAPLVQGTQHLKFDNSTETNITRDGCGVSKLCVETPDDCDPAGNAMCLFASVVTTTPVAPNGTDVSVELRGDINSTSPFVVLGLTANTSEGSTLLFACGLNTTTNATMFVTLKRNNTDNTIMRVETVTCNIRIEVENDTARCEFTVPGLNASTTRATTDTTFNVLIGTSDESLSNFAVSLDSGSLNIANPASNVVSTTPSTNTPTNTTSGSYGGPQSHGMLLFLSVVTLSMLFRA